MLHVRYQYMHISIETEFIYWQNGVHRAWESPCGDLKPNVRHSTNIRATNEEH
jgi:hypothetical protein